MVMMMVVNCLVFVFDTAGRAPAIQTGSNSCCVGECGNPETQTSRRLNHMGKEPRSVEGRGSGCGDGVMFFFVYGWIRWG